MKKVLSLDNNELIHALDAEYTRVSTEKTRLEEENARLKKENKSLGQKLEESIKCETSLRGDLDEFWDTYTLSLSEQADENIKLCEKLKVQARTFAEVKNKLAEICAIAL
jgi:predicted RNase H-like nuclease (RuvC/YqgF family)